MILAKKTYLIGSGKGGVGKSTLTLNLAISLAQMGFSVGLLDADLYGPSIPLMTGLRQMPPRKNSAGRILPITKFGVQFISLGFFIDENQSILWRGPMLHGMLQKMISEIVWGKLDYLVIDLPPGTGDVLLSLPKLLQTDGALLVTTPQAVAIADVLKAVHAFDQLQIPIKGVVENMSGYIAPDTGKLYTPFGKGGGEELALKLGVSFLGSIPLIENIREGGDTGIPVAFHKGKLNEETYFRGIAQNLISV